MLACAVALLESPKYLNDVEDEEEVEAEAAAEEALLQTICEEYMLAFHCGRYVGARLAGRIIARIHREYALPVPPDETLYCAIMQRGCRSGAFAMCYHEFKGLLMEVLRQCINGEPLSPARVHEPPVPECSDGAKPAGEIPIRLQKLDGRSTDILVDDSSMAAALQLQIEAKLSVPMCCQRLVFGTCLLDLTRPLYQQGVVSGATITVVRIKPQAMLLRIRRVQLGDISITRGQSSPAGSTTSVSTQASTPKSMVTRQCTSAPRKCKAPSFIKKEAKTSLDADADTDAPVEASASGSASSSSLDAAQETSSSLDVCFGEEDLDSTIAMSRPHTPFEGFRRAPRGVTVGRDRSFHRGGRRIFRGSGCCHG